MKWTSRFYKNSQAYKLAAQRIALSGVLGVSFCMPAEAQLSRTGGSSGWQITPRVSVGTTYSDNIKLAPANAAEDDLVLEVEPGVSVRKQGGRVDLRLDYTLQGLLYANHGDANTINHQLQTFGSAEIFQKHFFLDAYGAIAQVPTTSSGRTDNAGSAVMGGLPASLTFLSNLDLGLPGSAGLFRSFGSSDTIAITDNQVTGYRYGLSPYWRQDIGGWVEGLLRYRYDGVRYDDQNEGTTQQGEQQTVNADSQINTLTLDLKSSRRFNRINWNINYLYKNQQLDHASTGSNAMDSGEDRREHVDAKITYRLSRYWSLLANAGYEDSQVTGFENAQDGSYWGLGAVWSPNRFLEIGGLYGPDVNLIALRWNPSTRTYLDVRRRDRNVGVESGVHWQGTFKHQARASVWSVTYVDEVTNEQQLLGSSLLAVGADGQPLALTGQDPTVSSEGRLGVTNRNFRRKRLDAGVVYRRGATGISVNAFNEERETQNAQSIESTYGAGALWTWRFAPRIASFIGGGWERDDLGQQAQRNDYWVSTVGLAQAFAPNFGGLISYRYYQNDASSAEREFRENRLNVRFNMKF